MKHALEGSLLPQASDLWPNLLFCCFGFFFPPHAETSRWWSADATTRPRRQPDCHDAGHPGPRPVLLQRQADDGERPRPACTLKKSWPAGEKGWAMRRWRHNVAAFVVRIFQTSSQGQDGFYGLLLGRVITYFLPSGLTFSCYKGTHLQHAATLFWASKSWQNGVKTRKSDAFLRESCLHFEMCSTM